jgi:single-stranded-DNA-specific exonuclease
VGEKHLKMLLSDSSGNIVDAIAFNVDPDIWPKNTANSVQMAYKLDVNEFRNQRSVQLIVEALE